MTVKRTERVHQLAARDHVVLTVSKAREGYPTDDMSRVVVIDRTILLSLKRDGLIAGFTVDTLVAGVEPEDARDLGLAITQAADELLAEQAQAADES